MKRAWTKFWLCASALAISVLAAQHSLVALAQPQPRASAKRANELTLAGLRPGRATLAVAEKRLPARLRLTGAASDDVAEWNDPCHGTALRLEVADNKVIESATATLLGPRTGDCKAASSQSPALAASRLKTGRGLALNDPCKRIVELYGPPNSRGPSTKGSRELELLFYAFD